VINGNIMGRSLLLQRPHVWTTKRTTSAVLVIVKTKTYVLSPTKTTSTPSSRNAKRGKNAKKRRVRAMISTVRTTQQLCERYMTRLYRVFADGPSGALCIAEDPLIGTQVKICWR